jgi:hypothetical protein
VRWPWIGPRCGKGDPSPLDLLQQSWMADQVTQLQIDPPGQKQVVELGAQHQQLGQPHLRSIQAEVDVGAVVLSPQSPGAVEHHPFHGRSLSQQLQDLRRGFLREPRNAGGNKGIVLRHRR